MSIHEGGALSSCTHWTTHCFSCNSLVIDLFSSNYSSRVAFIQVKYQLTYFLLLLTSQRLVIVQFSLCYSSSSNVLSTITITNTTASFTVGETVSQTTNDVLTLEPVTDALNITTIGDLLLETSNSTFEERLVFDDQTTSGSGIVKSYFTDSANNKILIFI